MEGRALIVGRRGTRKLAHRQWASQIIGAGELAIVERQDPHRRLLELQLVHRLFKELWGEVLDDAGDGAALADNNGHPAFVYHAVEGFLGRFWVVFPSLVAKVLIDGDVLAQLDRKSVV